MNLLLLLDDVTITSQSDGKAIAVQSRAVPEGVAAKSMGWYIRITTMKGNVRVILDYAHGPDGKDWIEWANLTDTGTSTPVDSGLIGSSSAVDVTIKGQLKFQIQIAETAVTPTSEVVAKVSVWTVLAPF